MNVLIYSKDNCSYCLKAKNLLAINNIPYIESLIGKDILREDFISLFPEQKTVPLIIINEQKIGGYNELVDYIRTKPYLQD